MDRSLSAIFCVDVSSGPNVKTNLLKVMDDVFDLIPVKKLSVRKVRVKIVEFGHVDPNKSLVVSRWFDVSDRKLSEYLEYVSNIEVVDVKHDVNVIDALLCAVTSDWVKECDRRVHAIQVLSSNKIIEDRFDERFVSLYHLWHEPTLGLYLSHPGKRLILNAPNNSRWHEFYDHFSMVTYNPFEGNDILPDYIYEDMAACLVCSL